ncbi:MAG: hypothetical protein ACOX80_05560 [Methanomassiliicoccaceae archaeon]|nr:hypothetical protein [Euryarchaeota archaeon]HOB37833.1 hypothetical protein [Methanomassiliicoccaceae archaeon]HOQ25203.1 hypothetical protein [Methanomassiliicoccaceae archaeon]HQA20301.1 hypothetical protein [Methanomassiliicoccaceae archaeon]HQD87330.1 hypothetical protein [Methanomassiliicoccaceae archaeon]
MNEQFRSIVEHTSLPYDKRSVDPYTRARVLLMIAIENNAVMMKHRLARATDDDALKKHLAIVRRAESLQHQAVSSLIPADETPLETAIGLEQMVVDLTADLAQNEADDYFKQALDFALLEDLDHLFRFSLMYRMVEGGDAGWLTRDRTPIVAGRPTSAQHRHPVDELRPHFDLDEVPLRTLMNHLTIVSAEQEKMLFYKSSIRAYPEELTRRLFGEIAMVEEQHLSQYEDLGDPHTTPMELLVLMELNEAYNYFSAFKGESDPAIRTLWSELMEQELEHFHLAVALMERIEGRDAHELLGDAMIPSLIELKPNIGYIEALLSTQVNLQPFDGEFIPESRLPADWPSFSFRERMNSRGSPADEVEKRRPRERIRRPA